MERIDRLYPIRGRNHAMNVRPWLLSPCIGLCLAAAGQKSSPKAEPAAASPLPRIQRPGSTRFQSRPPPKNGNYYFNAAAFVTVPDVPGNAYGTTSRNFFRGPGRTNLDMTLSKSTAFTERVSAEIRVDAFNVSTTLNSRIRTRPLRVQLLVGLPARRLEQE